MIDLMKVADSDELCNNKQLQISYAIILQTDFLLLTLINPFRTGKSGLIQLNQIYE